MKKLWCSLLLSIIPTLISIYLLIEYFPYTGLARVITVPTTIIVNIGILIFSLNLIRRVNGLLIKSITWMMSLLITVIMAIIMHPQEYLPSVLVQIKEMIFEN